MQIANKNWILLSIASVISRLAQPMTAGLHHRSPRCATMSSMSKAEVKQAAASNSVRMMRNSIAMPPENASRNAPKAAMRQSRTSARSR